MCGYMGLDSMGSSLMETQKLSFEEQPDAKVKPAAPWGCGDPAHAGAGLSPASPHALGCHIIPFLGMSRSFLPSHRSLLLLCHLVVARAAARAAGQAPLSCKEPRLSSAPSLQVDSPVAGKLPKFAQLPQPRYLLPMSSTAAYRKMKARPFVCR